MSQMLSLNLVAVAGASLAALALACAPAAPAPAERPAEEAAKPAVAGAQYGGIIKYGQTGKMSSCYAYKVGDASNNQMLDDVVYETLVTFDYNSKDFRADLDVLPRLAERWEQPDPTTYILRLRKDVKWHDGKAFTADDVLATREAVVSQNFLGAGTWRPFKTMEKLDDHTLRLVTEKTAPMALVGLAQTSEAHMLPKHILDAGTMEQHCVGTGPFKVKTWSQTGASYVRNEEYPVRDKDGKQYPYLSGIEAFFNMNRSAMVAALAAQEIDVHNFNQVKDYEAFIKLHANIVTNQQYWSHHNYSLLLNLNHKPLDDIRVRKALSLLLDRHRANQLAWSGQGKFSLPVVPAIKEGWGITQEELPKMPGWRQGEALKQDQEEGSRLLREAGLADGLKMDLLYISDWAGAPWAEALPGLFKPMKIEIQLRGVDGPTAEKEGRDGNYDSWLRLVANFDPMLRTDQFFYSKAGQAKVTGVTDQGQDALIDGLRVELDKTKQKELVRKSQQIVVDNHWVLSLGDYPLWNMVQPWVNGYRSSFSVQPFLITMRQVWFDGEKVPAKRKA